MTTHKEALTHLKAITEAFGPGEGIELDQKAWSKLHSAIKEALAQPEQEPVAWAQFSEAGNLIDLLEEPCGGYVPLYTTPPQRKPLTDEQIVAGGKALAKLHAESCGLDFDDVWKYYAEEHKADAKAAIKAAHGIKE